MCGRFTYRLTWREVYELYRLTMPELPEVKVIVRTSLSILQEGRKIVNIQASSGVIRGTPVYDSKLGRK